MAELQLYDEASLLERLSKGLKKRFAILLLALLTTCLWCCAMYAQQGSQDMAVPEDKGWQHTPKPSVARGQPATAAKTQSTKSGGGDVAENVRRQRDKLFEGYSFTRLDKPVDSSVYVGRMVSFPPMPQVSPCEVSNIVVGTITDFQPYLTGDHTAIYAELYATVESVLKNTGNELTIGSEIVFLSHGGTLILPDKRVISSPRNRDKSRFQPGHKYVFFANYKDDTESYGVPEVWEINDGRGTRVIPVGILADRGSRSRFIGAHVEDFLSTLMAELNSCNQ
jgi:hypothetical protein